MSAQSGGSQTQVANRHVRASRRELLGRLAQPLLNISSPSPSSSLRLLLSTPSSWNFFCLDGDGKRVLLQRLPQCTLQTVSSPPNCPTFSRYELTGPPGAPCTSISIRPLRITRGYTHGLATLPMRCRFPHLRHTSREMRNSTFSIRIRGESDQMSSFCGNISSMRGGSRTSRPCSSSIRLRT